MEVVVSPITKSTCIHTLVAEFERIARTLGALTATEKPEADRALLERQLIDIRLALVQRAS